MPDKDLLRRTLEAVDEQCSRLIAENADDMAQALDLSGDEMPELSVTLAVKLKRIEGGSMSYSVGISFVKERRRDEARGFVTAQEALPGV